ncbi:hypothetical protein BZA77DRAFT_42724 [Pyronema omphalodes]|nr:hypothetical protein BZA77DRAFT_42724 [Pyronema omphalodes]
MYGAPYVFSCGVLNSVRALLDGSVQATDIAPRFTSRILQLTPAHPSSREVFPNSMVLIPKVLRHIINAFKFKFYCSLITAPDRSLFIARYLSPWIITLHLARHNIGMAMQICRFISRSCLVSVLDGYTGSRRHYNYRPGTRSKLRLPKEDSTEIRHYQDSDSESESDSEIDRGAARKLFSAAN